MSDWLVGYHFTGDTLRDGRPIPPLGEWLVHDGPVVPCESGLHASEHPFDALAYAPGVWLHRVELRGDLTPHGDPVDKCLTPHGDPVDKWVGRERRILASIDATALLREFARWCALRVIDLWDAPDVVREYLKTGDEELRAAAWAARDARDAAWYARDAGAAARAAARDAARDAARAAEAAAGAARDARDAAWYAAGDAAWDAAWDAQREKWAGMVEAAFTWKEARDDNGE